MSNVLIHRVPEKWRRILVVFIGLLIASIGGGLAVLHIYIADAVLVYSGMGIGFLGFCVQFIWSVRRVSERFGSRDR